MCHGGTIFCLCQKLTDRLSEHRMNQSRHQFVKWYEHKPALGHSRMRQGQKLARGELVFVDQQVEVNRTWSKRHVALATERIFDPQQTRHHLFGRGKRRTAQLRHHVEKSRLMLVFDRFGFINSRDSNNIQTGVEHATNGKQQVTGAIAEIGTEADVGVLNHQRCLNS